VGYATRQQLRPSSSRETRECRAAQKVFIGLSKAYPEKHFSDLKRVHRRPSGRRTRMSSKDARISKPTTHAWSHQIQICLLNLMSKNSFMNRPIPIRLRKSVLRPKPSGFMIPSTGACSISPSFIQLRRQATLTQTLRAAYTVQRSRHLCTRFCTGASLRQVQRTVGSGHDVRAL